MLDQPEKLERDKHSSLFSCNISKEEKSFYNINIGWLYQHSYEGQMLYNFNAAVALAQ
jgi:hypothetical protein